MPEGETIAALATPTGESALAVVRASGPLCPRLARDVLKRGSPPPWRRATYGAYHDLDGAWVDDGVLTCFQENHSFTGEAMLEFCCHGNPIIANRILEDLVRRGCRLAEPGEFSRTAFLNGRLDLSQAEAIADLISARSDLALRYAQKQMHGAVGRTISELSDRLLHVIAQVEAYIDFPEEDLPPEDHHGPAADLARLVRDLMRLVENSRYKALIDDGIRTVIVGPPNAGKSSLINLLVGEERALVSEEPGTTRDYIRERLTLDEFCIQILDTAGLHEAASDLEARGIRKTLELMESADFFLVVVEAPLPFPDLPEPVWKPLTPQNTLVLQNKRDLGAPHPLPERLAAYPRQALSIRTGDGYEAFRRQWLAQLRSHSFSPPPDAVVMNARHAAALDRARSALQGALDRLSAGDDAMLVASDLRGGLDAFGEVIGKVDNEVMLDILFQRFCIGK